jgi:tetratricopeptide (TPR) repeat protein
VAGALEFSGGRRTAVTADRYRGFSFDPADLAEDVDLDQDRRKEILVADAGLAGSTHWDALGLPWNAPAAAARAAYLEKVKTFHPDRYAGKRLGRFRGRLERVFRRITEAGDVLADEARRAAYARATAPVEEKVRLEVRNLEDERRAEERRARLLRQNPHVSRAARIAELVTRGREALGAGRFSQAANDLLVALGLDPNNAQIAALAAEAKRKASGARANEQYERGLAADALGNLANALGAYRAALEADPRHVRAAAAAARCALRQGDPVAARELADAAVRAGPGVGSAHEALGLVLEAQGDKKEARRELERAVALDPKLEMARERLKKLRWSFLG